MNEQEQKRLTHLMVLLWNTILSVSMIALTLSKGQEPMAAVLLTAGIILGWALHLSGRLTADTRLWVYTALLMLTFFFYGAHEENASDMAPVIVGFMLMYVSAGKPSFIRLCAAVYCLTMLYDLIFLTAVLAESSFFRPEQVVIHFLIVLLSERMAEAIINRYAKEKKHTEETIARLEDANRSAEDFLANASHELRTPINAVTGIVAGMLKKETDAEKKESLHAVQKAGNRLFNQVEDILDYSEIDTGRIIVSEEPYAISSIINDIIAENRRMERPLGVELIFDIDPRIPATLLGDGRKVQKIISHLTVNAMKFTERGGVHVRIYATHKPYGVNLCIRVSDTGIGITADQLEKITERFFQSNSGRNRKNGGLGLGLSIVYGMATAMGGFVQIESKEEGGTVVSVSIPQKVADAAPCMAVAERANLGLALYLLPEKYEVPEVRDQYNETISHMIQGLELAVHRVVNLDELKRLVATVTLSHLFLGEAEYGEDTAYFEQLSRTMGVILIAGEAFRAPEGSRIKVVRKPLCSLPVIHLLNAHDASAHDEAEAAGLSCSGVRALVVDDEPMNLLVAESIFKSWDIEVRTASSGRQAIELCRETAFDLIFLDHMMPDMDGVETLKELRGLWADAGKKPLMIAFSANVVNGAKEMFLREGFDGFIAKPIQEQELERLLRRLLPGTAVSHATEGDAPVQAVTSLARLEANGFLVAEGLRYCGRSSALYEEVLTHFARDAERKIAKLEAAFREQNLKDYQILAHSLKSSSKMIGAQTLSEMAKGSEDAAKNQNAEYIRQHHPALLAQYRETAERISNALTPAEDAPEGTKLSREEMLTRLRRLRETFDTYESDQAESLIGEMLGAVSHGTAAYTLLTELRQAVEDFEWHMAAEKADALISGLEDGEA